MDTNSNTVLAVVPESGAWAAFIDSLTESYGYRVLHAPSFDEAHSVLAGVHIDLVVAEHSGVEAAADGSGCEFLAGLRTAYPDVVRVLAIDGPVGDISRAAVYQFLRLPLHTEQACLVVVRALEARELARRHRVLSREFKLSVRNDHHESRNGQNGPNDKDGNAGRDSAPRHASGDRLVYDAGVAPRALASSLRFEKLVYVSDKMAEVCRHARIAARTDLPILIQGETGTGKEVLARAIHDSSARHTSPLLVQNCGGIPDALLISELFGHRRGALPNATADRQGLLRAAAGGTVFLDEISEISPAFQLLLLRFLQDGQIHALGADQPVTSDVRIVASSNRPLKALVASGEFRRDLYYRLKGFELEVPPLRERTTDILPLAEFFAAKHSDEARRTTLGISARAIEKFLTYDWPGNVRELENEIHRLVVLSGDGEYITTQHMSPTFLAGARRRSIRLPWNSHGKTLKDQVENLEKLLVHETLERCQWNQSKAAGELGLSRVGLANKIRRYGLAGPPDTGSPRGERGSAARAADPVNRSSPALPVLPVQ